MNKLQKNETDVIASPWLDSEGKEKSTEILKKESKNWSLPVWEKYVAYLEKNEPRQKETPIDIEVLDYLNSETHADLLQTDDGRDKYQNLSKKLSQFVERLPKQQRKVVRLYFYESLSDSEIGERLGIKASTVRSTLRNSKKSLRSYFNEML